MQLVGGGLAGAFVLEKRQAGQAGQKFFVRFLGRGGGLKLAAHFGAAFDACQVVKVRWIGCGVWKTWHGQPCAGGLGGLGRLGQAGVAGRPLVAIGGQDKLAGGPLGAQRGGHGGQVATIHGGHGCKAGRLGNTRGGRVAFANDKRAVRPV